MNLLVSILIVAVAVFILSKFVTIPVARKVKSVVSPNHPSAHKEKLDYGAVCPYCRYDTPWDRPWGLHRCNECQRHFRPNGYTPTADEAALLAAEEKDCRLADKIADGSNLMQTVAAAFPAALSYSICQFQNGRVVISKYGDSHEIARYDSLKTLAGNMRLCIRCMEYVQAQHPNVHFDLGEGFFGWQQ